MSLPVVESVLSNKYKVLADVYNIPEKIMQRFEEYEAAVNLKYPQGLYMPRAHPNIAITTSKTDFRNLINRCYKYIILLGFKSTGQIYSNEITADIGTKNPETGEWTMQRFASRSLFDIFAINRYYEEKCEYVRKYSVFELLVSLEYLFQKGYVNAGYCKDVKRRVYHGKLPADLQIRNWYNNPATLTFNSVENDIYEYMHELDRFGQPPILQEYIWKIASTIDVSTKY